ncbi:hypothetical protein [Puniceibacterium sediminis]|uniref:Uncharacterized protein n=1 Tax=Puniceibacterium sediminis TaxID=1608407 RepID=A0A238YNP9_9RHOB|nr:hypothetical protein [Puniceibacterium sediminis]SNR72213.1 hypothetical protein SAMN06265370_11839 [Puniceibacterium sediminis]
MDASLPQVQKAHQALTVPPFLICQSFPTAAQRALVALLDKAGALVGPGLCVPQAGEALVQNPDCDLVVLTYCARNAVADAMSEGTLAEHALAQWMTETGALLSLWRQNRRRVILLQIDSGGTQSADLAARLGLDPNSALGREIAALPTPAQDPVILCLAELVLMQSAEAHALCADFAAAGHDLTPNPVSGSVNVAAAAALYAAQQRGARMQGERATHDADQIRVPELPQEEQQDAASLLRQQELLMTQLRAGQAGLETLYLRHRKAEADNAALRAELGQARQRLAGVRRWTHDFLRRLRLAAGRKGD